MNEYAEPARLLPRATRAAAAVLAIALALTLLCPLRAAAEESGLDLLLEAIREAGEDSGKELSVRIEKDIVVDRDIVIPANLDIHVLNSTLYVAEGTVLTIDGSLFIKGETGQIIVRGSALVNGGLSFFDKGAMELDGSVVIEKKGRLTAFDDNRLTIRGSLVNRKFFTLQETSRLELLGSFVNEKNAFLSMEDKSVFTVAKEASYTDEGDLWVSNRTDCGIIGEGAPVYVKDDNGSYLLQSELERRRENERKEKEAAQKREEENAARKARRNVRIQYVDPLSGASFSAPAGWIRYKEDDEEEERVIFCEDIPIAMIIMAGNLMYYQSLDLWEGMTEAQKQVLPREKLDTALLSRNTVAKLLNVSQLQLKRWTCNGRVYYLYSGEKKVEILGQFKQAFAVCIVNGCLYRYTVAVRPTRNTDPAEILNDVLTTAEYPTPVPASAKGVELAEWGIGFGIAALILIVRTGLDVWSKRKGKTFSVWKALERAGLKLRKPAFKNSHTARLLLMLFGIAVLMAVDIWLERQGQGSQSRILVYAAALIMVKELTAFVAEGRALRKSGEKQKREDPAPPAPKELTEEPTQETEPGEEADAGEQGSE